MSGEQGRDWPPPVEPDVKAHRSSPSWGPALAAVWIAGLTLALVGWLLDLMTGAQAGAGAAIVTACVFIFVVLATPGSNS